MSKAKLTWATGDEVRTLKDLRYVIPQEVSDNQKYYADNDKSFFALSRSGIYRRAKLNAEAYGLYTTGTGDIIITII